MGSTLRGWIHFFCFNFIFKYNGNLDLAIIQAIGRWIAAGISHLTTESDLNGNDIPVFKIKFGYDLG